MRAVAATGRLTADLRPRAVMLAVDWQAVGVASGGFALVAGLAADQGGYFAPDWGWGTLAVTWVAALALVIRRSIRVSRREVLMVGALGAFVIWTAVSAIWSASVAWPIREAQRDVLYVSALAAGVSLVRSRSHRALLIGVWAAIVVVSAYSLSTRLFPERFGTFDPLAGYRLAEPLGYWNALGVFTVIGSLLALGLAARSKTIALRALAAASLTILLPSLYFTYSRGAWIALGAGLIAAIGLDQRRLQLLTSLLVVAPGSALVIGLGSSSRALTRLDAPLSEASRQGHRLAVAILVAGAASAALVIVLVLAEPRLRIGASLRRTYAVTLALVAVALVVAMFVRYGSPSTLVTRGYHALNAPAPRPSANLNQRLFTLASPARVAQWKVAWTDVRTHPWLGSGAGSYEQQWVQKRARATTVRDAHNLYLEKLAEVGPVGLGLLALALGVPLLAAIRARHHALVPIAFGAYIAYLVHAAIDWDWEVPAVALAALFCGLAILAAARKDQETTPISTQWRAIGVVGVLCLSAFAFVGLVGNRALVSAQDAAAASQWKKAESNARKAVDWAPWSSEALQELGNAQAALGRRTQAYRTLSDAARRDPNNWSIWYDVGDSAPNAMLSLRAYRRAAALNPLSPNIATLRDLGILPKAAR